MEGNEHKLFCQNLSLFAKLFIDHKVLYFDIKDYQFYVATTVDTRRLIGYFSRLRTVNSLNNLSCIVVFPQFQGKGYGMLLVALSYELSAREDRVCSPERPLSEMGRTLYMAFWKRSILKIFFTEMVRARSRKKIVDKVETIREISKRTFIDEQDVLVTLLDLGLVQYYRKCYILRDRAILNRCVKTHYREARADRDFNPNLLLSVP